jgi:glycosyltransferase involved in cell wall biosynthesis
MPSDELGLSVILPAHNEAAGIGFCLEEIKRTLAGLPMPAEVIVVDNRSSDATAAIVKKEMETWSALRLVSEQTRGYGAACLAGLDSARGRYMFLADADGTYDFTEIPRFLEGLQGGCDLVVGNRFLGGMPKDSMPWHHRYVGNPALSLLVRICFPVKIRDIHCGARAITRAGAAQLVLRTTGMEFASEMIVKAAKKGLTLREIPVAYRKRIGVSKLESFADGWRHTRFILLYSPSYLFLLPGAAMFAAGLLSMAALFFGSVSAFGLQFYVHPMFLSAVAMMLGYQIMLFAGFSRVYAVTHLGERDSLVETLFRRVTLEKAVLAGLLLAGIGAGLYLTIFVGWIRSGFGSLDAVKTSIIALTATVLGVQTCFSAFMLSTLGIKER